MRQKLAEELRQRGVALLMPGEAYANRDYTWYKAMGKR
jgi:hypothetical protein